jgi:selenocysteine-specific elongation factor
MTVVVGTAGHIDHGKTALLRALTGIDADRLPEERRRGMTIDVGYAHLGLPDGTELDFVDVPGHDRLVGNMLVGAGEIDATMLVVAADDGPRAQTREHLELLDALGLRHGLAVITKVDLVDPERVDVVRQDVTRLLGGTSLTGSAVVAVSAETGWGIESLLTALVELRDRVASSAAAADEGPSRLAIDRIFTIKGRGTVVTGTLRGGPIRRNAILRLVPGEASARARELQVHNRAVDEAGPGRTAINVVGIDVGGLHRGMVLTDDPGVVSTDRLLVRLARPLSDRTRIRVHLGTASVDGVIGRSGRDAIELPGGAAAAILRLATNIAVAAGDRFVLRYASGAEPAIGGRVLDPQPAVGISRRRQTPERVGRLARAIDAGVASDVVAARIELHGAVRKAEGEMALADDVADVGAREILAALGQDRPGLERAAALADVRIRAARVMRRVVTLRRDEAAAAAVALVERLAADGRVRRDGERVGLGGMDPVAPAGPDPELERAMDRLELALAVPAPPPLGDAARLAACPVPGIRELERTGRIVVIDDDLAYAASTYRELEALALELAGQVPLTPAALRDATGTSRKYVMAILADLDRRGILRRTDTGHVPGPRAPTVVLSAGVTSVDR